MSEEERKIERSVSPRRDSRDFSRREGSPPPHRGYQRGGRYNTQRSYRPNRNNNNNRWNHRDSRDSEEVIDQYTIDWNNVQQEPIPELAKLDIMLPLSKFLEFLDPKIDEMEAVGKYQEYKEMHLKNALHKYFDRYKDFEWFREMYHPTLAADLMENRRKKIELNYESFLDDLRDGKFEGLELDEVVKTSEKNAEIVNNEKIQDKELDQIESRRQSEDNSDDVIDNPDSLPSYLEAAMTPTSSNSILIKSIPPDRTRAELVALCEKVPGFLSLTMGAPNRKGFYRCAWAEYQKNVNIQMTVNELGNHKFGDFKVHVAAPRLHGHRIKTCPEMSHEQIRKDLERIRLIFDRLNTLYGLKNPFLLNEEYKMTFNDVDSNKDDIATVKFALDVYITYLRRVTLFCYYSATQCEGEEELVSKCGNLCLRKRTASTKNDEQWLGTFEENIKSCVPPVDPNASNYGLVQVEIDSFVGSNVKTEKEDRFRCGLCAKLFKGEEFVVKHIRSKHEDVTEAEKQKLVMLNNYLSDPRRPMPVIEPCHPSALSALRAPSWTFYGIRNQPSNNRSQHDGASKSYYKRPSWNSPPPARSGPMRERSLPPPPAGRSMASYDDLDVPQGDQGMDLSYK